MLDYILLPYTVQAFLLLILFYYQHPDLVLLFLEFIVFLVLTVIARFCLVDLVLLHLILILLLQILSLNRILNQMLADLPCMIYHAVCSDL